MVIPKILAQNSGFDPQETTVKLQVRKLRPVVKHPKHQKCTKCQKHREGEGVLSRSRSDGGGGVLLRLHSSFIYFFVTVVLASAFCFTVTRLRNCSRNYSFGVQLQIIPQLICNFHIHFQEEFVKCGQAVGLDVSSGSVQCLIIMHTDDDDER